MMVQIYFNDLWYEVDYSGFSNDFTIECIYLDGEVTSIDESDVFHLVREQILDKEQMQATYETLPR